MAAAAVTRIVKIRYKNLITNAIPNHDPNVNLNSNSNSILILNVEPQTSNLPLLPLQGVWDGASSFDSNLLELVPIDHGFILPVR